MKLETQPLGAATLRMTALGREALASAAVAALVAALLVCLGPPGSDLAAHMYQRAVFLRHGFDLWNNFWYAGRYSFVTYSLLYYPLAALLGIRLLAVATIATASLAFTVVVGREWGLAARWSSRTFAIVWAGIVLSAAFPFALGAALALLALWALQRGARIRFALLVLLALAASPIAFVLLAVVLVGCGVPRIERSKRLLMPAATLLVAGLAELMLWRLFPSGGRYPFPVEELLAACAFCALAGWLTWRVPRARPLRGVFAVYLGACVAAYLVPSGLGENIARLRFAATPLAVLVLSLRNWRPRSVAAGVFVFALSWNLTPLVASYAQILDNPASRATYWAPAIRFLHVRLNPSYRVEAVDTTGHWPAVYLPRAGIPLARGWFRQDDFPQNEILYGKLGRRAYLAWLRDLGVRYVVLSHAPPDYSARGEAMLLESRRSGLRAVRRTHNLTIYAVPAPRKLISGPGYAGVIALEQDRMRVEVGRPGRYRLAIRYSPYWQAAGACISQGPGGMMRLAVRRAQTIELVFDVDAGRALDVLGGDTVEACDDTSHRTG